MSMPRYLAIQAENDRKDAHQPAKVNESLASDCVSDMIKQHDELEELLDSFLKRQDNLIRELRNSRLRPAQQSEANHLKEFSTKPEEFHANALNCDFVAKNLIGQIDHLELQARSIQGKMRDIETSIIDVPPTHIEEALRKLRFLCSLIMYCDHADFEYYICAIDDLAAYVQATI